MASLLQQKVELGFQKIERRQGNVFTNKGLFLSKIRRPKTVVEASLIQLNLSLYKK